MTSNLDLNPDYIVRRWLLSSLWHCPCSPEGKFVKSVLPIIIIVVFVSITYRITKPEKTTFHLLHLSLFREYIDWEFSELKVLIKTPGQLYIKYIRFSIEIIHVAFIFVYVCSTLSQFCPCPLVGFKRPHHHGSNCPFKLVQFALVLSL